MVNCNITVDGTHGRNAVQAWRTLGEVRCGGGDEFVPPGRWVWGE